MPQIFTVVTRYKTTHTNYDEGGCYDTITVYVGIVLAESLDDAQKRTAHLRTAGTYVSVVPAGEVTFLGEFREP